MLLSRAAAEMLRWLGPYGSPPRAWHVRMACTLCAAALCGAARTRPAVVCMGHMGLQGSSRQTSCAGGPCRCRRSQWTLCVACSLCVGLAGAGFKHCGHASPFKAHPALFCNMPQAA